MNERFLMKAKHIETGNWIEGYYYKMAETTYCPIEDVPLIPVHHYILYETMTDWGLPNRMLQYEVDPDTLCQCTGIKDKNGKMIFENDILMGHGNNKDLVKIVFGEFNVVSMETLETIDRVIGWHYEVIPTDGLSKCEPFNLSMPFTDMYVSECEFEFVGNIFDNP